MSSSDSEDLRRDINRLIQIRSWNDDGKATFEFEHFSDDELAIAIQHVAKGSCPHQEWLKRALAKCRANSQDIGNVWKRGENPDGGRWSVSKPDLAETLWPILQSRDWNNDAEMPAVVRILKEVRDVVLDPGSQVRELGNPCSCGGTNCLHD